MKTRKIKIECDTPATGAVTEKGALVIGPHPEHPFIVVEDGDGFYTVPLGTKTYFECTVRPLEAVDDLLEAVGRGAFFYKGYRWHRLDEDDPIKTLRGGVYVAV